MGQSLGFSVAEVVIAVLTLQVGVLALIFSIWWRRYHRSRTHGQLHELEALEVEVYPQFSKAFP